MDEPRELARELEIRADAEFLHDQIGLIKPDFFGASAAILRIRAALRERRAGLSPIARTEIERVRDEIAAAVGPLWATRDDFRTWLAALDSVLGAESTKEGM